MQDRPTRRPVPRRTIVVPSRSDRLLAGMTEPVGGPLGKRTAPGLTKPGFFTVERVLVLMTAVAALLAIMTKSHCRTAGWSTPDQYSTGCFSQFPNSFVDDRLGTVFPFLSHGSTFDGSLLTGWVAGVTARLAGFAGEAPLRQLAFFDVNAALLAILWILAVVIAAWTAGRRKWDAAIVATSPLLILTAYVSWDLWAVVLVSLALYLFARHKTLAAGALLGVAAMAAAYPIVVLLTLLMLGVRARRVTPMLELLAAALVAWLVLLVPVMLLNPPAFPDYVHTLMAAEPTNSSFYGGYNLVAERMGWSLMAVPVANALMVVLLAVLAFGVATLAMYAPRRPRVGQLLFVTVGAFMLLDKGTEPWHAIWLLPLVALAMPRWQPVLLWQAAVAAHFIAWMLFQSKVLGNIENQHVIDMPYFLLAASISAAATAVMIGLVVRDIYHPQYDVVARVGAEDPHAGVLAGSRQVAHGEAGAADSSGAVSPSDAAHRPKAAGEQPA